MQYNVHIADSYKVSKRDFAFTLEQRERRARQQGITSEIPVFDNRSKFSLKMEWAVHNFLYALHIRREQTKDVDLDYPCDKPEWLYCTLGIFAWIFIK